jgi:hypothetical protein
MEEMSECSEKKTNGTLLKKFKKKDFMKLNCSTILVSSSAEWKLCWRQLQQQMINDFD